MFQKGPQNGPKKVQWSNGPMVQWSNGPLIQWSSPYFIIFDLKVNMQICHCVKRSLDAWNSYMIGKTKLAKERFRMKALFNKVLDFLLEGKNGRISFLYEAHEGEFIMLDITVRKLRSVMLKIVVVLRFDTKSSIEQ